LVPFAPLPKVVAFAVAFDPFRVRPPSDVVIIEKLPTVRLARNKLIESFMVCTRLSSSSTV